MENEKQLLIHKNTGGSCHYLILTRDRKGDNWDLPRYSGEDPLEDFLEEKLGITGNQLTGKTEEETRAKIEVTPETQVNITSKTHQGGIFLKKTKAEQLLTHEESRQLIQENAVKSN